jgi:hypothetical protein
LRLGRGIFGIVVSGFIVSHECLET